MKLKLAPKATLLAETMLKHKVQGCSNPILPEPILTRLERAAESDPGVQSEAPITALKPKDAQLATCAHHPLSTAESGESSGAAAKRSQSYRGKRRVLKKKHCPSQIPEGADSPARPASAPRPGWLQASCAETSPELADQEEPGWPLTALIGQTARLPAPLSNPAVHVGLSSEPHPTPPPLFPHLPTVLLCAPLLSERLAVATTPQVLEERC